MRNGGKDRKGSLVSALIAGILIAALLTAGLLLDRTKMSALRRETGNAPDLCFTAVQNGAEPSQIEIGNLGSSELPLQGVFIVADTRVKRPFIFTGGTLAPGAAVTIFGNETGGAAADGLTAPFGLHGNSHTLFLYAANGILLDSVAVPEMEPGVGWRRGPDGNWSLSPDPAAGG